jgi:hypothetical protein
MFGQYHETFIERMLHLLKKINAEELGCLPFDVREDVRRLV